MRFSSSLFVVLSVSALALAAPTPVEEGDVVLVKPKKLEPKGSVRTFANEIVWVKTNGAKYEIVQGWPTPRHCRQ